MVRDAIVARIESVPGVGPVHAWERFAQRESELRALYVAQDTLAGWYVRLVASEERIDTVGWSHVVDRWRVVALRALDDAARSEIAHDELVEAVRGAFRADGTLGGVVESIEDRGLRGLQIEDSGPLMWAGKLCHHTRMSLATTCSVEIGVDASDDFLRTGLGWEQAENPPSPDAPDVVDVREAA